MRPACQGSRPPSNAIRVLVGRPTAYNRLAVSARARRPPAYRDRSAQRLRAPVRIHSGGRFCRISRSAGAAGATLPSTRTSSPSSATRRTHLRTGGPVRSRSVRRSGCAIGIPRAGSSATAQSAITCCVCGGSMERRSGWRLPRTLSPNGSESRSQLVALIRDVSERKKLDDQSRDLYQQLLQAEKMAALGQTISGVAHELNNPLATILSWAERLTDKPLDNDDPKRGVEVILGEADRAARIVRNLLTFARKRQSTRIMIERESSGNRNADFARVRTSAHEYQGRHCTGVRAAAGLCGCASNPAGAAQPDHQCRAGNALGERPGFARHPHVARCRDRGRRTGSQ